MSIPEVNDVLRFEAYNGTNSNSAAIEVQWSQDMKFKSATYYIVNAKNTSKGDAETILSIQKPKYTDEYSPGHISKIPGAKKDGDDWVVPINDQFQYGQKNAQGEQRFLVFHDKSFKIFQHRFLTATAKSNAVEWAQRIAQSFGPGEVIDHISRGGSSFFVGFLRTF